MLSFVAQTTPPPAALSSFLEVTFYLIGIATAAVGLWSMTVGKNKKTHISPSPLVVQKHVDFVTVEEHRRFAEEQKAEFIKQASARKGLYEKIETQGRAIAVLQNETTSQTRQLHALDDKIDDLPEKLLRLMAKGKNL